MALLVLGVTALYVGIAAILTFVVLATTIAKYGTASGLMLGSVDAEPATTDAEPELHALLERRSSSGSLGSRT